MQDVWGSLDTWAWVIDGATRPGADQNHTVATWTRALSNEIACTIARTHSLSLPAVLASAIENSRLDTQDHPSATVAMARISENLVETLVLGDCAVLVGDNLIQDNRIQNIATDVRKARRQAKCDRDSDKCLKLYRKLLKCEDAARNREGGFWVASETPRSAHEALLHRFHGENKVLLMSDGVANEVAITLGGPAQTWKRLTDPLTPSLSLLRSAVLERDGQVDDMTVVRHSWTL
ncbi:protein phosphatase 2C domain-containing protein [Corynebacterium sp. CCM 8864]|uniref:Protein phosphatase 2C domain-containing protein n=1 Tax=Corynebacterium marambiense TaxID=2765364 RepID=A0ABS0VXS6_9CORY|nr:protein phosphatase 2C domain-containing protein [Corynebacterium marambiense]